MFVHQSQIQGKGFRYLLPGEPVQFDLSWDEAKERWHATCVRPAEGRERGHVKSFDHGKGFGFITRESDGETVFFHHSQILSYAKSGRLTAEEGEAVQFEVEMGPKGLQALRVKREDSRPPLLRFADMGPEEVWLAALAKKAEPETWMPSPPSPHSKYPILKNYVSHTFARLDFEDRVNVGKKIAVGRDGNKPYACFNTGLVTNNQEEIFCLFSGKSSETDGRQWKLAGFHAESDHEMLGRFEALPELANFFDDPAVLLYDRRCELYVDIDHVVDDNIKRFPLALQGNKFLARQSLSAAKTQTQQRVYRNYKTAVPQFHRGSVQLLLPLCLSSPNVADLALVVSRQDRQYRGETILTLDMAYNNARLLCRPDSEWLQP